MNHERWRFSKGKVGVVASVVGRFHSCGFYSFADTFIHSVSLTFISGDAGQRERP